MSNQRTVIPLQLRACMYGILVTATLFLVSCADKPKSVAVNGEEWALEELLRQITEVRKENKAIKNQLEAMAGKIDGLEITKPARPKQAFVPTTIKLGGDNLIGDDAAKVAIIEYTDYQCPFCKRHSTQVLPEIKAKLIDTKKIRYQVADYPLQFHTQAMGAAVAANCAGKQNQYMSMHDEIFANTRTLGKEFYVTTAEKIKLDKAEFVKCINNPENEKKVNESIVYGDQIGVTGTPKFFVGRLDGDSIKDVTVISGAQSYGVFEAAVEKLL